MVIVQNITVLLPISLCTSLVNAAVTQALRSGADQLWIKNSQKYPDHTGSFMIGPENLARNLNLIEVYDRSTMHRLSIGHRSLMVVWKMSDDLRSLPIDRRLIVD